ncbi:iron-containing alcohol dehydrogenase [Escherichia coli]|uniref:Iron-containing alcohol dehydrogenase n=1 Tax=Escherichia coli TaxID=562 RepID=A0A484VS47_ECOLX|nr:iron-containing alcohol dehydrogenase [Escherichia coli]
MRRKNICWRGSVTTLAKWYEAVVLAPQPETLPLTVRLGINNAQAIRDVLLNSSEQALADQQNQQLTQSFCDVVDAIIAGGGMVGGLGDRFTRVAAAHAVHNGLTVLPQTEKFLHGTKVAYGILVQSALLGQDDVLAQLTGRISVFICRLRWRSWKWISIIRWRSTK